MADDRRPLLAHLFRRAGFGADASTVDTYVARGYAQAVTDLLNPKKGLLDRDGALNKLLKDVAAAQPTLARSQQVWVQTMVQSKTPLLERMTLFLSNHFATAVGDIGVDMRAMLAQHATIREHALGSFADLAHAMLDDQALSCFLNNDRNKKAAPNENLARELMELFLLGPGNYTELDVKEVARALTGYHLHARLPASRPVLVYDKTLHDAGPKTILGTKANFAPHDVVTLLLKQPAAKRLIATKLVTTFVSPTPDADLVDAVVKALSNWQLKDALRVIFMSPQFAAPAVRQSLAKTPAEFVVGIMRALGRTEYKYGARYMSLAGQTLFVPPNVAGWPQGKRMLGPGSMMERYNAAVELTDLHANKPAKNAPVGTDITSLSAAFGITDLSDTTRAALTAYATAATAAKQSAATRNAGLITLLTSSPEFNLA